DERQEQVLDHMREYLADLDDESTWDEQFAKTGERLQAAAQGARKELQAGAAGPLDFDRQ
ncbi:MAG: hypothetical protein R3293_28780, partial [Candidatus Promineifilaceae bacterium]|nr:hypothetical protein [Candidatus Promineifilaceae bacterium]